MCHRGEAILKEIIGVKKQGDEHWQPFKPPSEDHPIHPVHPHPNLQQADSVASAHSEGIEVVADNVERHDNLKNTTKSPSESSAETCSFAVDLLEPELQDTVPVQEDQTHDQIIAAEAQKESMTQLVQSQLSSGKTVNSADESKDAVSEGKQSQSLDNNDPVIFCGRRLKVADINRMLNAGPCQPARDYSFPVVSSRSFNPEWFSHTMADKTTYKREWLSYSRSVDRAYCLPCIAFSGPRGSELWTSTGFSDWHNGARDVQRHECSAEHRAAEIHVHQWRSGRTISKLAGENRNAFVEDNRKVVECVIDCAKFLAAEMLAFWGNDSQEGKFRSLFKLMAKRDSRAAAYLQKIEQAHNEGKKVGVNLISPGNVVLVLKTMKQIVAEKIVNDIRSQRKTCIIFDSTQDYSKREASVLLVHYVEHNDDTGEPQITERLLEVFTTGETSGSVLTDHVLADLERLGVDLDWIIGQCYDGAGNMRGRYSGMATQIQKRCNKAVYIWCHAHRLNLVVNAVSVCSKDIKNTLGLLEELYVFMSGHKRNDVFCNEQGDAGERTLQLKRVSTTRWNSSQDAVDTVLVRYGTLLQTLSTLSESKYDSATITQATGLKSRLQDIRVIICMHILRSVYRIIGPASRSLQGIATDLGNAAALLSDCKQQFENLRAEADKEWDAVFTQSVEFAAVHGIPSDFPSERPRKKRRMDDELAVDECLTGKERMKVDTFIRVIDEVMQQLQSRFSDQNVALMKQLSYFTPGSLLSINADDLCSSDDIVGICDQYGLNVEDVHKEMMDFLTVYRVCSSHTEKGEHNATKLCISMISLGEKIDMYSSSCFT